jgi:hypothetical protein
VAPPPQDFGIGVAAVLAAMAVAAGSARLLGRALPRLAYLVFLVCFFEHFTAGDRFFAWHLWEVMGVSAATVMFLENRFPAFGLTCLAVVADFVRQYPTTAYRARTGVTVAIVVALVAWRYLAREDGTDAAPPAAPGGDSGWFVSSLRRPSWWRRRDEGEGRGR